MLTTHIRLVFLIGSVIHIQNIDLTISQSMTDCRRSTFTHHILPHKWTKPLPNQEGPLAFCSANHLQVEPSVRLTPAAGSTFTCTRWQLTWRCHFVEVTYHLYGLNTVPDLSLRPLWSIPNPTGCIWKKKNEVTDGTQTVKNFPVASCVHQGHACGTDFQAA